MPEVLFYHLTFSPLEAALPDLLGKSLTRGWRALVRSSSRARLDWLDRQLWTVSDDSFLPHGIGGGEHDAAQPILLTVDRMNPNRADILFLVDGADVEMQEISDFTRVCIMFDGGDADALQHARGQWAAVSSAGLTARYWAQEGGRWRQKAAVNEAGYS